MSTPPVHQPTSPSRPVEVGAPGASTLVVSAEAVRAAAAVIASRVRTTPVLELPGSELGLTGTVVLKLEQLQHSGTFKARGAVHALTTRRPGEHGVVAASGGNHGVAVAWAARQLGVPATVFVPTITAAAKIARLRDYGATVRQSGAVYADALRDSRAFEAATGAPAIHAYDDPAVLAGAGTCGMELETQAGPFDAVLVACGGGGLAGGLAAWFGRRTELVVCETEGTATYASARARGGPVDISVSGLAADSLGASRLGEHPWATLGTARVSSAVVSDREVVAARHRLWEQCRILVEPAAAVPLAVLLTGAWTPPAPDARLALLLCGANTEVA